MAMARTAIKWAAFSPLSWLTVGAVAWIIGLGAEPFCFALGYIACILDEPTK